MKLKSLEKRVEGAKRKLFEAKRAMWPTLGGEISSNGGILAGDAYTGESFKLNFSQPIFYGGELIFTVRQAEANLHSDLLKFKKERLDVIHQVTEAYYAAVSADYNLQYQNELYADASHIYGIVVKAHDAKLIPEIEYLELNSLMNQVEFQKETANTTLKTSYMVLHQNMGVGLDPVTPTDPDLTFKEADIALDPFMRMVQSNNLDIKIKQLAAETAFYGIKVFDAQKLPRVDVRGSAGLQGEARIDHTTSPDVEPEQFIAVEATLPWGPHTSKYSFQRRFYGPTISSFLGSEDYRHTWGFNFYDNLSGMTDEDLAKADYLNAIAELNKEKTDQIVNSRDAYFDYQKSVMQLKTSEAKITHRTRQVAILKHTTQIEESRVPELLGEIVALAEDKYSKITSIVDAKVALSNMNRVVGIEGYYNSHDT